ncbi:MAG: hypothetical protein AMXMBFR46_17630 [Acidimicrobiia bacterium]
MGDTRTAITLDAEFLEDVGLGALEPTDANSLLAHCYETLEMRVGTTLAEQMSDAQLTEFEQFVDAEDEAGALSWLECNFPLYRDLVQEQFLLLKAEIAAASGALLAHFGTTRS